MPLTDVRTFRVGVGLQQYVSAVHQGPLAALGGGFSHQSRYVTPHGLLGRAEGGRRGVRAVPPILYLRSVRFSGSLGP